MTRLHLVPGTRYLLQGAIYVVRKLLSDDRLLLECQSSGGESVIAREELLAAWARGELRFETMPLNVSVAPDRVRPTARWSADLGGLPEGLRDEAWRRYRLILPLVDRPPGERSRRAIGEYAASLHASDSASIPGHHRRSGVGAAISAGSSERWLCAFLSSGRDIRSLVPATRRQGGKGQKRLTPDVERIIEGVLAECAARPGHRSADDVYLIVLNRIADENRYRPANEQLRSPGSATVYRRIREQGSASILRRAKSRAERQAEASVSEGPRLTHILERVEIDHTLLDLFIVDEEDRLPIGRPTLTLAIDVYSRMPFGLLVGFEPPSYLAVMGCLLHGILPKWNAPELYGTGHSWPVWGLPEKLVTDNGREFVGRDLEDACAQLGVRLEPNPPRSPWYKGSIERFIRTHNTGLAHTLPGTTYSSLTERGDYDPAHHACISLSALYKLLHIWLLDVYAQSWHQGAKGVPSKRWAENVAAGWEPALHHSSEEVRILLLRTAERTIQRTGIDFESLRYQSPDLARLRSLLPAGAKVRIKYDPGDMGAVHAYAPTGSGAWLRVPVLDTEYAAGLSLWKHRAIRRLVLAEKGEVDIYALAEAKERVREIVREEMKHTRKVRGRKRAARVMGQGGATTPTAATPKPTEPTASGGEGWGGDYGLPTRGEPSS